MPMLLLGQRGLRGGRGMRMSRGGRRRWNWRCDSRRCVVRFETCARDVGALAGPEQAYGPTLLTSDVEQHGVAVVLHVFLDDRRKLLCDRANSLLLLTADGLLCILAIAL